MTHVTTTKWTCERCGRNERTSIDQPPDWWRVTITRPVLANPVDVDYADRYQYEVCPECVSDLVSQMNVGTS